ncbi:trypsin-like serine peptidase [Elusimicrobiota bacterium]
MFSIKSWGVSGIVSVVFLSVFFTANAFADLATVNQIIVAAQIQVIYGEDDRKDLYQIKDKRLLKLADSTVALFYERNLDIDHKAGIVNFSKEQYGPSNYLCKEEPFYDQPASVSCSGALVGPDIVLTASHCVVDEDDCSKTKFIFGFAVKKKGRYPEKVLISEMYGCKSILAGNHEILEETDADWALIQLDRKVSKHEPLKLTSLDEVNTDAGLVVIGYPMGLPVKVAGNAGVLRPMPGEDYFYANLDVYSNNSGSPVFNMSTLLIEGVLSGGKTDFVFKGDCKVSKVVPDDGKEVPGPDNKGDAKKPGEMVTKAKLAAQALAELNARQ